MKKISGFVLLVVVGLAVLSGCKNDSVPDKKVTSGTIKGQAMYVNGNVTDYSGIKVTLVSTNGLLAADYYSSRGADANFRSVTKSNVTNAEGEYTFTNVPEGVYTLYASSNSSTEKAVTTNVVVKAAQTVTADVLGLTATGSIKGKVTLNGKTDGVLGLDVFIAGTSYVAKVGDDGSYEIYDVPAKPGYLLCVQKGELSYKIKSVEVKADESTSVDAYNITYTSAGDSPDAFKWLGSFEEAPESPTLYSAYFNMTDGCSYIWDGSSWNLLAKGGTDSEMVQQLTATATEDGILFTGLFLNNVIPDYGLAETQYRIEILEKNNDILMVVYTKKWSQWEDQPWRYTYPLVEEGKEYDFTVTVKHSNFIFCEKDFTVTATGGLGEYKVENENVISFDKENKILKRTQQQVFTDNPNVQVLRYGTIFHVTSVKETDTSVWADGNLWLLENWSWQNPTEQTFELKKGYELSGWRDYSYLESNLIGRNMGVWARTRIEIAGYTYNTDYNTVFFELNDYVDTVFDWDDEEQRKVFLIYMSEYSDMPFSDVPGTEKRYLLGAYSDVQVSTENTETDTEYSFVQAGTEDAMEVWGTFVGIEEVDIKIPTYIPDMESIFGDKAEYFRFTGRWDIHIEDIWNSYYTPLPYPVKEFLGNATQESLIDGKYVLAIAHPEFVQVKADLTFYDKQPEWDDETQKNVYGNIIHSTTVDIPASGYLSDEFLDSVCSFPVKENYEGRWSGWGNDDKDDLVEYKYYPEYEPRYITINYFNEDGTLYRSEELSKDYYFDEYGVYHEYWGSSLLYIESLPYKEGFYDGYWEDQYGHTYYTNDTNEKYNLVYILNLNDAEEPVFNLTPVYYEGTYGY